MMVKSITEFQIFESPDGGETVYVRTSGQPQRVLYSESQKVKDMREELNENQLWHDIRKAAKTNKALHTALEHVKIQYYMTIKDHGTST
jgi:hypothetical protein